MESEDRWMGTWDDRNVFPTPTGQWPWEIETAYNIVKASKPRKIVEIGCLYGGTLAYWLRCLEEGYNNAVVIGIDPEIDKVRDYVSDQRLILVKASSHSDVALNKVMSYSPIDVLFIDGDHSYEGAKKDFMRYGTFVRPGGLILLHDIATFREEVGVPKLWGEIKLIHHVHEIIGKHTKDIPGGGIGIVYT